MKVRALKAHTFAGKNRAAHDVYKVPGHYLKLVRALGWAEEIPSPTLDTDEPVVEAKTKRKYTRKAPYKRRDMRAED